MIVDLRKIPPVLVFVAGVLLSCHGGTGGDPCTSRADCPEGYFCDLTRNHCRQIFQDDGVDRNGDGGTTKEDGTGGDGILFEDDTPGECPDIDLTNYRRYCILPDGYECDYRLAWCGNGEWNCDGRSIHPPEPPNFDDWAWRCGVFKCDARTVPEEPGDDWQEERFYIPPKPDSLTGEWKFVASEHDTVPKGCERQPRQYGTPAAFVVDPVNPDVMYVGYGMLLDYYPPNELSGVFKTVDGGATWFEARAGLGAAGCYWWECTKGTSISTLYMDPDDRHVLFASTENRGLYRTTDGGKYWHFIDLPWWCYSMGPVGKAPDGTYYAACENTLFRSHDDGTTWEEMGTLSRIGRAIMSLAFDRRYPQRIWAGMKVFHGSTQGEGPVFLSEDGGNTWTDLGREIDAACLGGADIHSIEICPANPDVMAVSAGCYCGFFLSEDGGRSWYRPQGSLDFDCLWWSRFAPDKLSCRIYTKAFPTGTYWSEDGGRSWHVELDGVGLDFFYFNKYVPQVIFGAAIHSTSSQVFQLWIKK